MLAECWHIVLPSACYTLSCLCFGFFNLKTGTPVLSCGIFTQILVFVCLFVFELGACMGWKEPGYDLFRWSHSNV